MKRHKNKNWVKIVTFIVITVLLCQNITLVCADIAYAIGPSCLNSSSSFKSAEFRGVIKPFTLIANLLNRKNPDYEDLVLIRSVLSDHLGLSDPDALALVYNKDKRELFAYTCAKFLHFYKSSRTKFRERPIEEEMIGRINIAGYEFSEGLQEIVSGIKDAYILGPEKIKTIPIPKRLNSDLYKKTRFWLGFLFLVTVCPGFLAIYGVYSVFERIADFILKWYLDEKEYQRWIERRRYGLLSLGIPILRILPFLRTELMVKRDEIDEFNKKLQILAGPEVFSEKRVDDDTIKNIISKSDRTLLDDENLQAVKAVIRQIAGNLPEILENTSVYLVGPGSDVNNPFLFNDDDKDTNSYVYTFVNIEIPKKPKLFRRIRAKIRGRDVAIPGVESSKKAIYISKVFYEQLSRNKPLLMMLLAERIISLAEIPSSDAEKILAEIDALNNTGITLDMARAIIKNAYFCRKSEFSPLGNTKGIVGKWVRKKILAFIDWSQRNDGWFQFLKLMMSEFFTLTVNWIRTPFLYPIRRSLHCGMPTPDNPLPEYGSYLWALQCGFSETASRLISEADACTDNVTKGWAPKMGSQSRHFNMYLHDKRWEEVQGLIREDLSQLNVYYSGPDAQKLIRENYAPDQQFFVTKDTVRLPPNRRWSDYNYPDTRLDWAQYELERAVHFYKMGEKKKALECLGRGLHSLQDLTAHTDFDTGPFGTRMHPVTYDDPNYDVNGLGGLIPSSKRIRVKDTERLTKLYLEIAKERFKKIDNGPERKVLQERVDKLLQEMPCGPIELPKKSVPHEASV